MKHTVLDIWHTYGFHDVQERGTYNTPRHVKSEWTRIKERLLQMERAGLLNENNN